MFHVSLIYSSTYFLLIITKKLVRFSSSKNMIMNRCSSLVVRLWNSIWTRLQCICRIWNKKKWIFNRFELRIHIFWLLLLSLAKCFKLNFSTLNFIRGSRDWRTYINWYGRKLYPSISYKWRYQLHWSECSKTCSVITSLCFQTATARVLISKIPASLALDRLSTATFFKPVYGWNLYKRTAK